MIVVRDLRKSFGEVRAVNGVSFEARDGEITGLLGPNGAGKTTTIGIITSLINKTGGSVKVFGIDIDDDFPAAKRLIGVVPQEFNFSIFEKVEDIVCQQAGYYGISRNEALIRCEKYLKQLGLWQKRHTAARELSGGMKQKLALSCALLHKPEVLFLDEPTVGVDPQSRNAIFESVEALNKEGLSILYTTHYMEEVERLCSRVAIVDHGKIILVDRILHQVKLFLDNK